MKKIVVLSALILGACVLACCKSGQENTITLVTYNVGAFHKPGFCTEHMCEQMLLELDPDGICLNELDSCNKRGGMYTDQLAQVAGKLGDWPYIFGSAIPYKGGSYGIGVLSDPDYEILDKWAVKLPQADGHEVRALAVIENEKFVICGTHLDLTSASQLAQVAVIDSLVAERYAGYGKPVFLCGDMNATPESETISRLQENWERLSSTDFSFSTDNPRICIDYIFAYRKAVPVKVLKSEVCTKFKGKDINAFLASDHFPSMVKIEILETS